MSYILQRSLFTYEDFVEETDDNSRLVATLMALPDEELMCWLRSRRQSGRNDYPPEVMWRCLIARSVYQIKTYAELIRELRRNGSLRRLVGIESMERGPNAWNFSRFVKRLAEPKGEELLRAMFETAVSRLAAALPGMGRYLAVDGTSVHAYSNEKRREKSDPDAKWGARPKRQRRGADGAFVDEFIVHWFGYLVHLVVDCETELPVAYEVTAANVSETTRFVPLLERLSETQPELMGRTEAVLGDAGYDSGENCRYVLSERGALPIIKMRLTQPKDKISQAAESLCTELGTQLCPGGEAMVYAGRDGDYLKWRCPMACGRVASCPEKWPCTEKPYGAVRKVSIWADPRRYPGLWRESKKWERLYKKRTAVERVNGRLKNYLLLDDLTIRRLPKVRVHVSVALLCLLAGAQAMATQERWEEIRRIVRLAA